MGSGALNGMADGFMSGAITGAITGAVSGIKSLKTGNLRSGKSANICDKGSSQCFTAGTKILTEHGKKNIEDINVGDKVWSWNETKNKQELKPVVQLFRNNKRDLVYITIGGGKITTTTEHPFYVKGKGWVRAKNLLDTDILVCYNGDELKIESVQIDYADNAVQTYNFEVEGNHNYYVGDVSVLAHNVCKAGIYNSVKDSPSFNSNFKASQQTKFAKIKNGSISNDLNNIDPGRWRKAYQNGFIDGKKYSLHYFKNMTNNHVFNIKYIKDWVI